MSFYRVKAVIPLPDFMLSVHFENGENKTYDVKPLFSKWDVFKSLKNINGLFEQVRVDTGGYGIVWNDYIDLSCDELYFNGTQVKDAI